MIFKKIDHVEIVPKNSEVTIDFYVNILDFKITSRKQMKMAPITEIIYLELGGTVIEIQTSLNRGVSYFCIASSTPP